MTVEKSQIQDALDELRLNMQDFIVDEKVAEISYLPGTLEFYRSYVAANKPVVLRGVAKDWPACSRWVHDTYLTQKLRTSSITLTATPTGYADAPVGNQFVLPEETTVAFPTFLSRLKCRPLNEVLYVQKQNSNLTDEFGKLLGDISRDFLSWGRTVFGSDADALNFWMGDERAVTSMHRDHYENLYCVIRGEKTFILAPPTDLPYIPYSQLQNAIYKRSHKPSWMTNEDHSASPGCDAALELEQCEVSADDWTIEPASPLSTTRWIVADPENPNLEKYPNLKQANFISVTVKSGDILYLPSLWFHHVRQSHMCIAVNMWYDMQFDIKYCYYKMLEKLCSNDDGDASLR